MSISDRFNHALQMVGDRSPLSRLIAAGSALGLLAWSAPVLAHHPLGGRTPANVFEGFMSGLGHPVIGADHFVFVVAVGLLAALKPRGLWIPIAFVLAAIAGTGLHLMSLDLPAAELFISASIVAFGLLLAVPNSVNAMFVVALAAFAGIFHGYAYGEAIIGAEMTSLIAYLGGFTLIQLAIALGAHRVAQRLLNAIPDGQPSLNLRFAGFAIGGAGAAFLSSVLLG